MKEMIVGIDPKRPEPREYLGLGLILVVAAALRFADIGTESLWNGELATTHNLEFSPLTAAFWAELRLDVHPPAYLILLRIWVWFFGDGEVALRAPSALAGVACCGAVWSFTRRHLGVAVAVTAALLSAVSPLLVQYGHEARSYSLLCLSTVWVAHTWLELVTPGEPARSPWLAAVRAGLAAAGAAYVHYSGLIVAGVIVLVIAGYAAICKRDAIRALLRAALVAAALYAPWGPFLFEDLAQGGLSFFSPPDLMEVVQYPLYVLPSLAWIAIALLAAIAWVLRRTGKRSATPRVPPDNEPWQLTFVAFLLAWTLLTLAAFFIKSRVSTPIFNVRNLIVVAPPIAILAAWATVSCARGWTAGWIVRTALVVGLCAYHLLFETTMYGHRNREQFREATQCAIALVTERPKAVVVALTYDQYFDYYLRRLGSEIAIQKSVSRSARLVDAAADAWAGGADHVVLLWGHIPLKREDRKRILKGRWLVKEERLTRAGCVLLARE